MIEFIYAFHPVFFVRLQECDIILQEICFCCICDWWEWLRVFGRSDRRHCRSAISKGETFTLSYINIHINMHIALSYMILCMLSVLQIVVLLLLTIFWYVFTLFIMFSWLSMEPTFFYWAEILWPWIMLSGFDIGLLISFKWWLHYRDGVLFMCMFACRRVVLRNEREELTQWHSVINWTT